MKHAGPEALDKLEPLLRELRRRLKLKERSRGVFYLGAKAFLHFHEHGKEVFADLRESGEFRRFAATRSAERKALLRSIDTALSDGSSAKPR
jgi:hypothetical protein